MSIALWAHFSDILRLTIACIFGAAVVGKVLSLQNFVSGLTLSFSISGKLRYLLAASIITLEFFVVVLCLEPTTHSAGVFLALVMTLIFTCVLLWMFFQGELVQCNCFGESERAYSQWDLMRNCILIAFTVAYLWVPHVSIEEQSLPTALTLSVAALLSVILIQFHDVISGLFNLQEV